MAVKKAGAKARPAVKKPVKVAPKKPTKTAPVKKASAKTNSKPSAKAKTPPKKVVKVAKPVKAPVKVVAKKSAKPVVKSATKPHKESSPSITSPAVAKPSAKPDVKESNTSKIVDMIVEKKAKNKPTTAKAAEPKEKKPSLRSKLAEKAAPEPLKEHRFNFNLKTFPKDKSEFTTEEKLQALFQLQLIDSEIDRIRIIRGELPMEVLDLEDEIAGLDTRIKNYEDEVNTMQTSLTQKKQAIKDSNAAIKKYESQQMNVKNNREFDSLNKEIEYQQLEIQLSEKRIKEFTTELAAKTALLDAAKQAMEERLGDLKVKKDELDNIIAETRKEEDQLIKFSEQAHEMIDERLSSAYQRIRENAKNGLAVVTVQRDACGGCFNKIPPQRQLDIRQHKKIIVCEHCGRILVDHNIEM